jgi:hypothetical protein
MLGAPLVTVGQYADRRLAQGVELDTMGLVTRARTHPTLAPWSRAHWESIWRGCNR